MNTKILAIADTVEVIGDSSRGYNGARGKIVKIDWPWVMVKLKVRGVEQTARFSTGELALIESAADAFRESLTTAVPQGVR